MQKAVLFTFVILFLSCKFNETPSTVTANMSIVEQVTQAVDEVIPGAEQLANYVPLLKGKRVGVVANQASIIGNIHLIDTLLMLDLEIKRIFVPEHGFRGKEDAGAIVQDGKDGKTGIPIKSLYGKNKKPKAEWLEDLDILLFDLQDVGVRCYTYISTLHYVMEAAAEASKPLIVLDRPNPNAHFVDGPVLQPGFESFVGMHPVPFVYGMTIGEYAQMINGEGWLNNGISSNLTVVECGNYNHESRYALPVKPSPNLPTFRSVLLYPSLVFFEGTTVSVGRGTDTPFEVYGHPDWESEFSFMPKSKMGASKPKHENVACKGSDLSGMDPAQIRHWKQVNISFLLEAMNRADGRSFFLENKFFDKLAGTDQFRLDLLAGKNEAEIRNAWEKDLEAFRNVRFKYLLY